MRISEKQLRDELSVILKHLEFIEGRAIGILAGKPGNGYYESWNDGEYEISVATKKLRSLMGHHKADYLDDGAVAQVVERGAVLNQPVAEVGGASPSRPIPTIETENVWKSSMQYTQALLKSASDVASIQNNRINKAVAYLTGLSMFGTAKFSKDIGEAIDILQGTDYFTQMQQTEMDSIKASGV